ncbi:MAG: xanthine dehydrogenase family protein subunit M, partial [Candidatus Micrarchaeaceae archaeon]
MYCFAYNSCGELLFPKPFEYYSPKSLGEAVSLLSKFENSRIIAGGQSLLPMMKLRLSSPDCLIDISGIKGLSGIAFKNGKVLVGAMTRISEIERSEKLLKALPALNEAASHIGDVQVRNMGTIGGNISNADPSNDMPLVALACGAEIELYGKHGGRKVHSEKFFVDAYTTDAKHDEVVTALAFPEAKASAYARVERRMGDYALAACAVSMEVSEGKIVKLATACSGTALRPVRLDGLENELAGKKFSRASAEAAVEKAA